MINFFDAKNIEDKVVVATDAGSSKKTYGFAKHFGCPIAIDKIKVIPISGLFAEAIRRIHFEESIGELF